MTELKASLETIQTTAKELITEIEGHFTELQQQRQAEQEQKAKTKETLLLNGKEDSYGIYQLARREETMDLRFEPFDRLQATGHTVDRANYETPTVADLEQRAKAGEAISVTDLAKAVKAEKQEQPQKKTSILKKLDEYKKQAAQQPKDKQKEHKKDLEV